MLVTPIKIQGKKTKIIPEIQNTVNLTGDTIWIEPFLGSGEVLFNINPNKAIVSDNNIHIINFYKAIQEKKITSNIVREFLEFHGAKLEEIGEEYYYTMRNEFNKNHNPLYFLFLNRSCFNGMIRFNSKNEFNVPFCRKPNRFSKALITKIVNQVEKVENILHEHGDNWKFICSDWQEVYKKFSTNKNAMFYFDPPYIKRHSDYFEKWTEDINSEFFNILNTSNSKFLLSNWYENAYRKNDDLINIFNESEYNINKISHTYQIGAKEINRNEIIECLVSKKDK